MTTTTPNRPTRNEGESVQDYVGRLAEWAKTPEGIAYEAFFQELIQREAQVERRRQQHERVKHAGIPLWYLHQFGSGREPNPTEAIAALACGATIVVLAGNPGCGKTTAACHWLMEFINAPTTPYRGPKFTTAGQLARAPKYDEGWMRSMIGSPRLVIDDLGMEYLDEKGFFLSTLDELIDGRYSGARPTLLTTNLTVEKFRLRYKERIADRLREVGEFVEISNGSLRPRAQ